MDGDRFDHLTHQVSALLTRRTLAAAFGVSAMALPGHVDAKKKKKKSKFNVFGCVDVGKFCKNNGQCCSNRCAGKKGKKTCKAHDQSTCQVGQVSSPCGDDDTVCVTSTGDPDGACHTTTGKAPYCSGNGLCATCQKDADCEALCGAGAACVPCAAECAEEGTACLGLTSGSCAEI